MKKKKLKKSAPELNDDNVPSWVKEDSPGRSTPYTEEELDRLVDGIIQGIDDTAAWINLVHDIGEKEARLFLRTKLIMMDENAQKATRH